MSASAIYDGWVAHRRFGSVPHGFRYRVLLPLFDLEELPELLDPIPLWSARRPAPAWFRRSDYLGGRTPDLAEEARDLVADRTGRRPAGPVRLLASPRYLGIGFNPVSFYFVYGQDGSTVEAVIAEVTNTPWGERAAYVIDRRTGPDDGRPLTGRFRKAMHVSPFQPMGQTYEIEVGEPGEDLRISIRNIADGETALVAGLSLRRRELTRTRMAILPVRYPPMTAMTLARIYANAARLKLRGARFYPHPASRGDRVAGMQEFHPSRARFGKRPIPDFGDVLTSYRRRG